MAELVTGGCSTYGNLFTASSTMKDGNVEKEMIEQGIQNSLTRLR